ncbi:MAG: tetratricopeptide repeat protein [Brumimicrobium sp.]|nr:tetratricopeptide repeat protein [Brumimicrobium sp.]
MNNIATYLILGLTLAFSQVYGQTYKQQFDDLVSKQDTLGLQQLLDKWEQADSEDPELYVAYFNYFAMKSEKEIVRLDGNPKGKEGLQVMDNDSTNKEPIAFLYSDMYYDPDILKKGFDYIDIEIEKHPNRLDMRFGKIYMFGQIEDYEKFTNEIIKTIDYSVVNKNKWTWTDSEPLDDPNIMLSAIQDYQFKLYNTENDDLLDNMKRIAEAVLKHYPDNIESLSNISIVFILQEQYDKAIEALLKAEEINPKDYIVLSNIAFAYKQKGDTKKAIKYYELTLKYGDEQSTYYAKQQIEELKKK